MFRVTVDLTVPTRLQSTLRRLLLLFESLKVLLSLKVRGLLVVGNVQTAFQSLHHIQVAA